MSALDSLTLLSLADRVESLTGPCRETDGLIYRSIDPVIENCWKYWSPAQLEMIVPHYTDSLDAIRTLGGMVVFASDIGADGLAMVKIVVDTSTSPIVEHTGIASQLQHAWLAAALRARSALEASHG